MTTIRRGTPEQAAAMRRYMEAGRAMARALRAYVEARAVCAQVGAMPSDPTIAARRADADAIEHECAAWFALQAQIDAVPPRPQ